MTQPAGIDERPDRPTVLFVCVHNAGRSQMAAGYLTYLGGDQVNVFSSGSEPADQINPIAVQAMAEEGIDIMAEVSKVLTSEAVKESDVVITMAAATPVRSSPESGTRTGTSTTLLVRASTRCDRSAMTSRTASNSCWPNWCPRTTDPKGERP